MGKRLELLHESLPEVSRVAVLWDGTLGVPGPNFVGRPAQALGLSQSLVVVYGPDEIEGALETGIRDGAQALYIEPTSVALLNEGRIVAFASQHGLPAMFGRREAVALGGLMGYGPNLAANWRRAAVYVDKILKGAKPADLPVEQPREFEFVINLKTAEALGHTIPQQVLLQATEVIQ
jgi:putative ABC transport system substrate-binding protein